MVYFGEYSTHEQSECTVRSSTLIVYKTESNELEDWKMIFINKYCLETGATERISCCAYSSEFNLFILIYLIYVYFFKIKISSATVTNLEDYVY